MSRKARVIVHQHVITWIHGNWNDVGDDDDDDHDDDEDYDDEEDDDDEDDDDWNYAQ